MPSERDIAECVGLWLAEGDTQTKAEITFTNTEISLVSKFHDVITSLFSKQSFNTRLYVYSAGKQPTVTLQVNRIKRYVDKRARRPYYVWRLASVSLRQKWSSIVAEFEMRSGHRANVLRGFFAGEGNIKTGTQGCRTIRIAQLKSTFVETVLTELGVNFRYRDADRSYYISHKDNWDIFAELQIADLHPYKKRRFWEVYASFKEDHYRDGFLSNSIYERLRCPYMTRELALEFGRSVARIQDILIDLKRKGHATNYRVGSHSYWVRTDSKIVIVSYLKRGYLRLLKRTPIRTSEAARFFKVGWKSASNRLKELERVKLAKKMDDGRWCSVPTTKKVVVL